MTALAAAELPARAQLAFSLQTSLALVFLAAAASKVGAPRSFVSTVAGYGLVPRRASVVVAAAVVAVELFVAASFLGGFATRASAVAALATLVVFAAAVGLSLARGREIPCGCFGAESEPISGRSLRRIAVLVAAATTLVALEALHAPGMSVASVIRHGGDRVGTAAEDLALAAAVGVAALWIVDAPALLALARLNRFPKPSLDEQPEGGA